MLQKLAKSLALVAILAFVVSGCSKLEIAPRTKLLKPEDAKAKVEKYINANLMAPGTSATIKSLTEENGLYKVVVDIGQGQTVDSYLTKDGTKFFPQGLDVKDAATTPDTNSKPAAQNTPTPSTVVPKQDKVTVELFVMSFCPYGTQIEKGILPAIEALGSKVNFQLKFCDYAMHGQKELNENLTQTCIIKEQPTKLDAYLKCFLEKGEGTSDACMAKAKVDTKKVAACVAKTDKEFKVTDSFNNKTNWKGSYPPFDVFKTDNDKYGVGGSPTLVINGTEVQSNRDSASLLATICSGYKTAPAECKTKLSSDQPAPGFGTGTTPAGSGSAAGCATN